MNPSNTFPPHLYTLTADNELLLPDGRKVAYVLHPERWQELADSLLSVDAVALRAQIEHLLTRVAEEHEIAHQWKRQYETAMAANQEWLEKWEEWKKRENPTRRRPVLWSERQP